VVEMRRPMDDLAQPKQRTWRRAAGSWAMGEE